MEMMAVIEALESLKRACTVAIHTDSRYVMDGMTQWIHKWKASGWKTAAKSRLRMPIYGSGLTMRRASTLSSGTG